MISIAEVFDEGAVGKKVYCAAFLFDTLLQRKSAGEAFLLDQHFKKKSITVCGWCLFHMMQ